MVMVSPLIIPPSLGRDLIAADSNGRSDPYVRCVRALLVVCVCIMHV